MKKAISICLFLLFLVGPVLSAYGQNDYNARCNYMVNPEAPAAGSVIADFFFVRPFGFAAIAVGTLFTVASLPFSIPSGSTGAVAQKLVAEPFNYTFTRPLGCFPGDSDLDIWP